MTNKMIDVDVLTEELAKIKGNLNFCNDAGRYWLDVAIETINELATPAEPQESIFDADGWCWDMSLLKADGTHVLLFDFHEGVSIGWRTDAGIYGHADLINLTEEYPKREILDKIIQGYVIKWEAWKPFKFPTGGNNDK